MLISMAESSLSDPSHEPCRCATAEAGHADV